MPDDLSPAAVSLVDPLAVGRYYSRLGAVEDRVPLVVGLGAIGLGMVLALHQRGAETIVAADFNPARRELAAKLGATHVVDPAEESAFAAWRRAAWGSPDEVHDRIKLFGLPRCSVYECVGREGVLADLVAQCPNDTKILSAGGAGSDTIPSAAAHLKGVNLQFGGGPAVSDWYETLDLVVSGAIDPAPLIGETVGIEDLAEAIDRARSAEAPPRIVYVA